MTDDVKTSDNTDNDYKCVVGVVYIGGCGSNNLRLTIMGFNPKEYPDFLLFGADTDAKVQKLFYGEEIDPYRKAWEKAGALTISPWGKAVTKGRGAGADPEVGRKAAESSKDALKAFYAKVDKLILVGAVGGGTGTGGLPMAAALAKEMGKTTLAIVVIPDPGEGKNTKATAGLKEIVALVPTIAIHNAYLKEHMKTLAPEVRRQITHKDAWEIVNKHSIVPMIRINREIIQVTGAQRNLDESDWETSMTKYGNHVLFGLAEYKPEEVLETTAEKVVTDLFFAPFQNGMIARSGKVLVLWNHGPWPYELSLDIRDLSKMKIKGSRSDEIEVHHGVANDVTDGKIWTAMLVVAKELTDENSFDKPADTKPLSSSSKAQTINIAQPKEKEEKPSKPAFSVIRYQSGGVPVSCVVTPDLAARFNSAMGSTKSTAETLNPLFDEVDSVRELRKEEVRRPDLPKHLQPKTKEKKSLLEKAVYTITSLLPE